MCGKYYADREFIPSLAALFREKNIAEGPGIPVELSEALAGEEKAQGFDVSPMDTGIVISLAGDRLTASGMKWGFMDPYHDSLVINARAETAREKKMFSESIRERRCVVPATGYYEWDGYKRRFRFTKPCGGLVLLAGIYRMEQAEPRYTILTTEANSCMEPVHPRMPVTIDENEIRDWIENGEKTGAFLARRQEELFREQDSGQLVIEGI